jgi:hypothetical protein
VFRARFQDGFVVAESRIEMLNNMKIEKKDCLSNKLRIFAAIWA